MVGYLLEVCFSHSVHQPNYCQPVDGNSEIFMLKFCLRIEDNFWIWLLLYDFVEVRKYV